MLKMRGGEWYAGNQVKMRGGEWYAGNQVRMRGSGMQPTYFRN